MLLSIVLVSIVGLTGTAGSQEATAPKEGPSLKEPADSKPSKAETAAYITKKWPKQLEFVYFDYRDISIRFDDGDECMMRISYTKGDEKRVYTFNFEEVNSWVFRGDPQTYIIIDGTELPFMIAPDAWKTQLAKAISHLHNICSPKMFD